MDRGTVQRLAVDRELRPVAGAIPAPLEGVPMNDATGMGAHGRTDVEMPTVVAIGRNLLRALPNDGSLTRLEFPNRGNVAAGHVPREVRDHGGVLTDVLARRPQRDALRRVGPGPGVVAPEDEIAQQHAGDHAR